MRFAIGDREYEYNEQITVEDAMLIWDKARVGVTEFNQALLITGNPYAIAAWMFVLKRRAGEAVRWEDMLRIDIRTFRFIPDEDRNADDESEDETPDPPLPTAGKTRRRATSATS